VTRHLRVVFSLADEELHYTEVARGTLMLGREPAITGDPIPPEVLKGIEAQMPAACKNSKGVITYARADARYAMDFEAIDQPS
jgi:hypothetical protein